ncbi:MAG: TonB-dependent receptor plug domain-containing protein [Bacteroidota bacterium]
MKNSLLLTLLFTGIVSIFSCGSAKDGVEKKDDASKNYLNLADYLRTKPGVIVSGTGNNVNVRIRGINSIENDTRPFYYLDGVGLGRSYATANGAVNPNNIKSVRVLSSLSDLVVYGANGNNGIILIKSKIKR